MKNSKLLIVLLSVLLCVTAGCSMDNPKTEVHKNADGDVYDFGTGKFRRINIDGVDCVIGAGTYDHAVAVSCDWERKDT